MSCQELVTMSSPHTRRHTHTHVTRDFMVAKRQGLNAPSRHSFFEIQLGGSSSLADFQGASEFAFAAVSLRPRCTQGRVRRKKPVTDLQSLMQRVSPWPHLHANSVQLSHQGLEANNRSAGLAKRRVAMTQSWLIHEGQSEPRSSSLTRPTVTASIF